MAGRGIADVRLLRRRVSRRTTWHVLQVVCTGGPTGLGECSDVPGADLERAVSDLAARLVGTGLDHAAGVVEDLRCRRDEATDWSTGFLWSTLAGALDCALLDLTSQLDDVPMVELVAAEHRSVDRLAVPLYANLNRADHDRSPQAFAASASTAKRAGFTAVKIAPFDGPHPRDPVVGGLDIVRAVRGALSTETDLMVDVHHRLSEEQLARALPLLEACDITWLEDAVDVLDHEAVTRLCARTTIPLAGGEHLWQTDDVRKACTSGELSYLLIDPKHVGGPTLLPEMLSEANGATVTYHNPSGPVGTALAARLTTLSANPGRLEYAFGQAEHRRAVVSPLESVDGGMLHVRSGPGLGISLVDGAWTAA